MEKYTLFGEILYLISNYEKGRCNPVKLWNSMYKKSLFASLTFMNRIVDSVFIETYVPPEELYKILLEAKDKIHCDKDLLIKWTQIGSIPIFSNATVPYPDINQLMSKILLQSIAYLKKTNRHNKKEIWYLLHAFHNLPKVYFNGEISDLGNKLIPISPETALEYAYKDLAHLTQALDS